MALIYGRPVNLTYVGSVAAAVLVAAAGGYLVWRWLEARRSASGMGPGRVLGIEHSGRSAMESAAVFSEAAGPLGSDSERRGEQDRSEGMTGTGF